MSYGESSYSESNDKINNSENTNGNKNFTIGVILGNANSPHTAETIKGIKEAASELSINIICYTGVHSSYFFKEYFSLRQDEDFDYQASCVYDYIELTAVDALIISYGTLAVFLDSVEINRFLKKIKNIPTVFIENRIEGKNTSYVIADNYNGMRDVMEHLVDYHGYRNVLYLSGPRSNTDAIERLNAYRDVMNERGIPFSEETSIAYGDFSERVEREVNFLLDNNPDVEAICCANDKMAETVYNVLRRRKILYLEAVNNEDREASDKYYKNEVGRDIGAHGIAVTGYDNVKIAENLDPSLTTVVQNAYSNGYKAVYQAVDVVSGKEKKNIIEPPKLIIRNSCGCEASTSLEFSVLNEYYILHPDVYAAQLAKNITDAIIFSDVNEKIADSLFGTFNDFILKHLNRYLHYDFMPFDVDEFVEDMKDFISGEFEKFISLTSLATTLSDYLSGVIANSTQAKGKEYMIYAMSRIMEYIHSKIYTSASDMVAVYEHRTWFMPLISRDMTNYLDSEREMYRNAMNKMKVLGMGNAYLFMFDEPSPHKASETWQVPSELRLVAYAAGDEVAAYDFENAPVVNKDIPLNKYIISENQSKPYYASVINLYSGIYQYGVLLAEIEPENILSLYYASVQISTALKYCEMTKTQRVLQSQLEKIIEEVEQKNEILRSLSEYDQLTGCLNRRGFLERASELIHNNEGAKGVVVFADLDHLKEINDRFGHGEGDFAIKNSAYFLKNSLPKEAILSRLGGDEFIAMFILEGDEEASFVERKVKDMTHRFNMLLAKPYYIECSVGVKEFVCQHDIKIEDIMNSADEALYEAKKLRKPSVVKQMKVW